jgi:serine kinase of HPr protein (carbohydrate metabolism regulator)
MTDFTIKLAGQTVAVSAMFESSKEYCREYLCQEAPDFEVVVTQADLDLERVKAAKTDLAEGRSVHPVSDAQLETTAIQRKIAEAFFQRDILLFHGSVVAVDGVAYLFTAKSGTGKSTHSRLWREVFGDRAVMVNDDKPFLQVTQDGIIACGSPWNGKHHLGANIRVPLKAICILERGEENQISRIPAIQALPMLMQQSNRPMDRKNLNKYMELVDAISASVAFYRLQCNMQPEAAEVSFKAMSG